MGSAQSKTGSEGCASRCNSKACNGVDSNTHTCPAWGPLHSPGFLLLDIARLRRKDEMTRATSAGKRCYGSESQSPHLQSLDSKAPSRSLKIRGGGCV